eukprot:s964_g17.t1
MHWAHSILFDDSFLSPWEAVETATDLAYELGIITPIRAESIVFPTGSSSKSKSVSFAPQVQVHAGSDAEEKFLPLSDPDRPRDFSTMNHGEARPGGQYSGIASHPNAKQCPAGDTGGSHSGDRGMRSASSTPSLHHFLDRRLPDEFPPYLHHLQHLWRERGDRGEDGLYRLRTWYVRHPDVPQCRRPRIAEIEGDGTTWHRDILEAWRDQLQNHARLTIAVAFPGIRMRNEGRATQADLLLVQGDPDFCGGLTTVHPPNEGDDYGYTWAVVYPRHLSGLDIVTGADATTWIANHQCDIYHDWTQIPTDATPNHWMVNGHTFVVIFNTPSGASASSAQPSSAPQAERQPEEEPADLSHEQGEESPQVSDASFDEENLQGIEAYGLRQPQHHCFVRWATYNSVLFDLINSLGINRDEVVGYHYLQATPVGQHDAEESVILQRVGDVPLGSADQLVLVDVTLRAKHPTGTTYTRQVHLLPNFLRREGLLEHLQLRAYCEWQDDRCTVHHNNALWSHGDLAPRQTRHGTYLRVEVPEPKDCDISTEDAIRIAIEGDTTLSPPSKSRRIDAPDKGDILPAAARGSTLVQTGLKLKQCSLQQGIPPPTVIPASSTRPTRNVPEQLDPHSWLQPAGMTFLEHACAEHEDEGPVVYWTTWYLHAVRHRRTSDSRMLRLDVEQDFWYNDLCELWADVLDPALPGRVIFVQPTPPRATQHVQAGHLLFVQGSDPARPVLLSGQFQNGLHTHLWQVATFVDPYVTGRELCHLLDTWRWCARQICYITCGGDLVDEDAFTDVQEGDSIVVSITSCPRPHDQVHLMQRSIHLSVRPHRDPQSGLDLPPQEQCRSGESADFQPRAAATPSSLPSLSSQSEFVKALYSSWSTSAFSWDGEEPSCVILAWMVDHLWVWPHCDVPRPVQLHGDYTTWETTLRNAWQDELFPGLPLEFHVVYPRPPTPDPTVAAHVVLIQRPEPDRVTSVVTAFDMSLPNSMTQQRAITTHEHIQHEHVVITMDLALQCLLPHSPSQCETWYGHVQLHPNQPIPGRSGYGLVVQMQPRPQVRASLAAGRTTDGMSLLQTRAHVSSPPVAVVEWKAIPPHCKLDEESVITGPSYEQPLQDIPDVERPGLRLGQHAECMEQLHTIWHHYSAVELEEEGRVLYISTWYSDPTRWPQCRSSRPVRLLQDTHTWVDRIAEAWDDRVDPDATLHIYMLTPQPRQNLWDSSVQPHVLLVQHPLVDVRSIHFSIVDVLHMSSGVQQHVGVLPAQPDRDQVLRALRLSDVCQPHSEVDCMVWFGDFELRGQYQLPLRDGNSLMVLYNNLAAEGILPEATRAVSSTDQPAGNAGSSSLEPGSDDSVSLLQTQTQRLRKVLLLDELIPSSTSIIEQERLTEVPVAHTLRPCCPQSTQAVRVHNLWSTAPSLPSFVKICANGGSFEVQEELKLWGHDCKVLWFEHSADALCIHNEVLTTLRDICIYFSVTKDPVAGPFVRTHCGGNTSDKEHMQFLYTTGYWRSVIVDKHWLHPEVQVVLFDQSTGIVAPDVRRTRPTPNWPAPMPLGDSLPMFDPPPHVGPSEAACKLQIGVTRPDLHQLFNSSVGLLHTNFEDIGLDQELFDYLSSLPILTDQTPDRYLVYVDGSSQGHQNHRPVEWIDERGIPDAWAMIVLAEIYESAHSSAQLLLVGWTAQQVRYSAESRYFLGASHTGATVAEREGLTWAFLWRIGINSRTPTLFRSDSQLSCNQAVGRIGTDHLEDTFLCLRGAYQLLETALPDTHVDVEHIYGHSGEPFNDFKAEAHKSFFLPRPPLNMTLWRDKIPHLWMIFGEDFGCPPFLHDHFDAAPPDLPPLSRKTSREAPAPTPAKKHIIQLHPSFCTANVLSMYSRPDGFAGKLGYLIEQFQAHALLFGGIQEARTPSGSCQHRQTLRFCSGAVRGQGGVELWINTQQPYGYDGRKPLHLQASHVQIIEANPRLLLARVTAPFLDVLLVVGHAPHSGRPEADRLHWWQELTQLLRGHAGHVPLFVMIDANAAPGDADDHTVFADGLATSRSTPLWRAFLEDFNLALPQTTDLHQGGLHTWTSIDGSSGHCLDYVAIPSDFMPYCAHSQLLSEFDLGNDQIDHVPLAVELRWSFSSIRSLPDKLPSTNRFDRSSIRSADLSSFLAGWRPTSWSTDVEHQIEDFNCAALTDLCRLCPPKRGGPKKSFITPEIWTFRTTKLQLRQRLHDQRIAQGRELLHLCFRAWRHENPVNLQPALDFGVTLRCRNIRCFVEYRCISKKLKLALKEAKKGAVATHMQALPENASASSILHALRPLLGSSNLQKQGLAPLPQVRQSDGSICSTAEEALDRWVDFFCSMEGGQRIDAQQQRQLWITNLQKLQAKSFDYQVTDLPSLAALEAAFRQVTVGKATGPDHIPAEICCGQPARMAKGAFPLMLKTLLHGQEPLQHKGGRLVPIWKRKLDKTRCDAYRSILISSHVGKCVHRALRLQQASVYESYLRHQQIGGQRKAPVNLGVHVARAFLRANVLRHRSAAFLFLDLSEAFYRVIRPLAVEGHCTDADLARIAQRLGLGPSILEDLRAHLRDPCATERAALPAHLSKAIQALHLDTHWRLGPQADQCRTTVGTRPGDAFADVIFGYLWSRVLTDFQSAVGNDLVFDSHPADSGPALFGRTVQTEAAPTVFMGPCWMDDLCLAFSADTCVHLLHKVKHATGVLLDHCLAHAMTPNLAPGKTEALFSLRGTGSRAHRIELYGPTSSRSMHIVGEYHPHEVRVVPHYTHLGCTIHHSGDLRAEIRRRLGLAHNAFKEHRKILFRNSAIQFSKKVELFHCLVLSKFLYGTESWVITDQHTKTHLHSALMRLFRRLLTHGGDCHLTDEQILFETGLPSPTELLRIQRLRYLGTLLACRGLVDWGLLNNDHSWMTLLEDDLHWLWFQLQGATHLRDPKDHIEEWLFIAQTHRSYWKRLIRRGSHHAVRQRAKEQRLISFHRDFIAHAAAHGFSFPSALGEEQLPDAEVTFGCMTCGLRFKSRGGESAHMNKVHQQVNPVRTLFQGTQCQCCLKEYFTAAKMKAHLLRSHHCRQQLVGRGVRFAPLPGSGSTEDAALTSTHDRLLPPLRALGPLAEGAPLREFEHVSWTLVADLCDAILDMQNVEELGPCIRRGATSLPISWSLWVPTLDALRETIIDNEQDEAIVRMGLPDILNVIATLQQPSAWSFLTETAKPVQHLDPSLTLETLEWQCMQGQAPLPATVPRSFGKHRIVLHAFSGRRRVGDFQFYLDQMLAHMDTGGIVVHTVSLDIIVDSVRGDISSATVRAFWLNGIEKGWILAMLAGPPCETWSRARGVQVADSTVHAPRIIRTAAELWGIAHLRLRELEQIDTGNLLLCFSAEAFLRLACAGGFAVIEHPKEPEEDELASIWRLPIFQLLCSLPQVDLLPMSQGLLGAASMKPTHLMVLNMPGMGRAIVRHQITSTNPKGGSIGRTANGQWATSSLKEYPPAMSQALADQFCHAVISAPLCSAEEEIDEEFLSVCQDMTVLLPADSESHPTFMVGPFT